MVEALQALFIRIDTAFGTLAETAMVQLVLKMSYTIQNEFTKSEMNHHIKQFLHTDKVERISTDNAIDILIRKGMIASSRSKLKLTTETRNAITKEVSNSQAQISKIVKKYFSNAQSELSVVKEWFKSMNLHFFQECSSSWIRSVSMGNVRTGKTYKSIDRIAEQAFRAHPEVVSEDHLWLVEKYVEFLLSTEPDEHNIKWGCCSTKFSSTLISAGLSADPIAIDMLKNSTLIIDTNVLLRVQLEGYKYFSSIAALDKLLSNLGTTNIYLFQTKSEYLSAINKKLEDVEYVLSQPESFLLDEIDDPFIRTGRMRGCKNIDDYRRMFDELRTLPKKLCELSKVTLLDIDKVNDAFIKGQSDERIKQNINTIYKRKRRKGKDRIPLEHDAGMICACLELRKEGAAWIFTTDSTLMKYSQDYRIRDQFPIALGVSSLIHTLALNNASIGIDPTDSASLFSDMIQMTLEPSSSAYQLEDVSRMYKVWGDINELDQQTVRNVVIEVHKKRVMDEPDKEIELFLRRRLEKERTSSIANIDNVKADLRQERHENELIRTKAEAYRSRLVEDKRISLQDKYGTEIRISRTIHYYIIPAIVIALAYVLIGMLTRSWISYGVLAVVVGVFVSLLLNRLFWKPKLTKCQASNESRIEREANEYVDSIL